MKTEHKTELKERMKKDNKKFIIKIQNQEQNETLGFRVTSEFESIEEALHKIELDLMTNLHHNFQTPIKIVIKEIGV